MFQIVNVRNVIPSAARNLLLNQKKQIPQTFAPKVSIPLEGKVPLGDGFGMTSNFEMAT